jgi:hypothetical protein
MSDQAALPNLNANWVNAKGQFLFTIQGVSAIDLGYFTRLWIVNFTNTIQFGLALLTYWLIKVPGQYIWCSLRASKSYST